MRFFLAITFLFLAGCTPALNAHDVSRSGVIALAGAVRSVHSVCNAVLVNAVQNEDQLTPADVAKVMHVGDACETALKTSAPILESAAQAVDTWKAGDGPKTACSLARVTDALTGVVRELRALGADVPWELDQAMQVGKFAGAACVL